MTSAPNLTEKQLKLIGELPLSRPPHGQVANFTDPESNAIVAYTFAATCVPLVLVFAGLRLYAKTRLNLKISWIDYYYVFSMLAGFTYTALVVYFVSGNSFGHHAWDVLIEYLTAKELEVSLILQLMISPVMWLVKLNLFFLFLHVFQMIRWLKILAHIGIVVSGCFYAAVTVANGYYCVPRTGENQLAYILALGAPTCLHEAKFIAIIAGAVNIAIDFYILIIPLPAVWLLALPRRKKYGILTIFLTGLLACMASILSVIFKIHLYNGTDNTWDATPIHSVGILEVCVGLIIPCMPAASKVMLHVFPGTISFLTRSTWKKSRSHRTATGGTKPGKERFVELKTAASVEQQALIPEPPAAHIRKDTRNYPENWPLNDSPNLSMTSSTNSSKDGGIQKTTDVRIHYAAGKLEQEWSHWV